MNPYLLPDGHVQVAFSGGRSSAYMLHQIISANGLDAMHDPRVQITFQNTGFEHEATLNFVAEVGRRWGVPITWLEYRPVAPFFEVIGHQGAARRGEPFSALVRKRRYLPNQQSRFCTIELKVRTAKRYLVSLGWERWTNCVGFRADEPARLNKPQRDRWTVWHPLATAGVTKQEVALFWRGHAFDLQLPNANGKTPWGNCLACFLKSERVQVGVARDFPQDHAIWEGLEDWVGAIWPSLSPWQRLRRVVASEGPEFARKVREAYGRPVPARILAQIAERSQSAAQFSKRFSKRSLRRLVEDQGDWILSDEAGLCQADDGECTG
ncbi:MAG: hypothetical protein F9K41_00080 [Sphingopyxis terrae]|nr:MAG: hypothetical protein F9K41_00080 [Sphingopyxis terrae]